MIVKQDERDSLKILEIGQSASKPRIGEGSTTIPQGSRAARLETPDELDNLFVLELCLRTRRNVMQIHKKWTKEEVLLIEEEYPIVGAKGLIERLGRSRDTVNKKAQELGIKFIPKKVYVRPDGYLESYEILGNREYRRFLIHREKMEKKLGRKLTANEVVHHKDGDKLNNRLSNLKVLTRAVHIGVHREALLKAQRAKSKI